MVIQRISKVPAVIEHRGSAFIVMSLTNNPYGEVPCLPLHSTAEAIRMVEDWETFEYEAKMNYQKYQWLHGLTDVKHIPTTR